MAEVDELIRQAEQLRATTAVLVDGRGLAVSVHPPVAAWRDFARALAAVEAVRERPADA